MTVEENLRVVDMFVDAFSVYKMADRQIIEWHAYWDALGMWVQLGFIA